MSEMEMCVETGTVLICLEWRALKSKCWEMLVKKIGTVYGGSALKYQATVYRL